MSHVPERPSHAVHRSAGCLLLVLALACGGPTPAHPSGRSTPQAGLSSPTAAAPSSPSPSPSPTTRVAYRNARAYANPLERYAYIEAFGRCSALGVNAIADAYGGRTGDALSAAAAYAGQSYPEAQGYRPAATQGCLDGFREG